MLFAEDEMRPTREEPDVVYTSAVEWPTLQEAMRARPTWKGTSRESDDEWGGRVWDGVTDWFM